MPLPATVRDLVARFKNNEETYRSTGYNETQTRVEFLDPLFKELGWDIANTQGFAEAYKDVIHEDRVLVSGKKKNPDYAFRVGGVRKFYLEAKKPSLFIGSDISAAIQLRRYGWSGKMPVSVLSNFDEISIYDTRVVPTKRDSALTARIKRFESRNFETDWDEIESILSKNAIQKGSFDKFVANSTRNHQTLAVDDTFLRLIEGWRDDLAKHIFKHNPAIDEAGLREVVQSLIDRIVFLRIAEDRSLEPEKSLFKLSAKPNVYDSLKKAFIAADKRYNSGLFHLGKWKSTSPVDVLSPGLKIGDNLLKGVIQSLYYPQSPYEFSVVPADVLGQVYERFLGRAIVLRAGEVTSEYRAEVKKDSGVYYTPTYIAEYIVRHTLGSALGDAEDATSAPDITVIDPACGSGSFLLAAYEFLLSWYRDFYKKTILSEKAKSDPRVLLTDSGELVLSLVEKKRILSKHIFGVDIDAQAIEVAKLSLHLRMLQGEQPESVSSVGGAVLPDLDGNFRRGNALIDASHFERNESEAEDEVRYELVSPLDWEEAFPGRGGFDVVIGNPPYFSIDNTFGAGDTRLQSMKVLYPEIYTDKTDIYYYFLRKALTIGRSYVGFICSRAFLEAEKAFKLRENLAKAGVVLEIVDFSNAVIFDGVGIATAIIILRLENAQADVLVSRLSSGSAPEDHSLEWVENSPSFERFSYPRAKLSGAPWNLFPPHLDAVSTKIDQKGQPLGEILSLGQGMQTGDNKVFGRKTDGDVERLQLTKDLYKTRVRNTDIRAYHVRDSHERIIYLEDVEKFSDLPKPLQAYLRKNAKALRSRAAVLRKNCLWWQYTWPLNKSGYDSPRIVAPYLAAENRFAVERDFTNLGLTDTTVLFDQGQPEALEYICCLLNSRLLTLRFHRLAKLKGGGIYEYFASSLSRLPIRRIDFSKADEKSAHDDLVNLHAAISKTTELNLVQLGRRKALQKRIDTIIYRLYGLSDEEVAELDR